MNACSDPRGICEQLAEIAFKKKQSRQAGVWCKAKSLRIGVQMLVADRRLAPTSVLLPGEPSPAQRAQ
jgi:hypothetical protein